MLYDETMATGVAKRPSHGPRLAISIGKVGDIRNMEPKD